MDINEVAALGKNGATNLVVTPMWSVKPVVMERLAIMFAQLVEKLDGERTGLRMNVVYMTRIVNIPCTSYKPFAPFDKKLFRPKMPL